MEDRIPNEQVANFEPVNLKLTIPPMEAKGYWKNEIALALMGILLTLFLSLFSLFYVLISFLLWSVFLAFVSTILFVLILKINAVRGFINKFVVWWIGTSWISKNKKIKT